MAGFWAAMENLGWETVAIGLMLILLATGFWMLMSGRLVPRSTLEDSHKERDLWRQAHQESEHTRQAVAELLDKVVAQGAVTNELLNQLRSGGRR